MCVWVFDNNLILFIWNVLEKINGFGVIVFSWIFILVKFKFNGIKGEENL